MPGTTAATVSTLLSGKGPDNAKVTYRLNLQVYQHTAYTPNAGT